MVNNLHKAHTSWTCVLEESRIRVWCVDIGISKSKVSVPSTSISLVRRKGSNGLIVHASTLNFGVKSWTLISDVVRREVQGTPLLPPFLR